MENIYSRLLAGESADDIAKEFADALNAAQTQFEEEEKARKQREEEAAKAKAAREVKAAAKKSAMVDLVTDFLYFIGEYYPSLGFTVEDVDAMDMQAIMPSKRTFKLNGVDLFNKAVTEQKKTAIEDPFAAFFKEMGL